MPRLTQRYTPQHLLTEQLTAKIVQSSILQSSQQLIHG